MVPRAFQASAVILSTAWTTSPAAPELEPMAKLDWYKRSPSKFLSGTAGLRWEVKGAYGIVLDLIYDASGKLPDDPARIVHHLGIGMSKQRWSAIRAELLGLGPEKLYLDDDGNLRNARADRELGLETKGQKKTKSLETKGAGPKTTPKTVAKTGAIIDLEISHESPTAGQQRAEIIEPKKRPVFLPRSSENMDLGLEGPNPPAHARKKPESESESTRPRNLTDVVVQVDAIAEALGQSRGRYWASDLTRLLDGGLTFDAIMAAARAHRARSTELIKSLSALRGLALRMDPGPPIAGQEATEVKAEDWKTALVKLAQSGVWDSNHLGDMPGTPDYRGPKDLERDFLEAWKKNGSHPLEELDRTDHWRQYPADDPDPERRKRWSRIP
jgi:uncharacterized protein YdaU (DUF1376 family)